MTPKEIECFIAVAEELSFRLAAERLFISQPPLTRHIQNLEEELGVLLFSREKKRVRLTYAGRLFYTKAKDFLKQFNSLKDSIKISQEEHSGVLHIDFTFFGIIKNADQYIKAFKEKYPKIQLIINETPGTYNLKESLLSNKTDIAFSYGMKPDLRLENMIQEYDSVLYAVPSNNQFADHEYISLKDLSQENFIFFPRHVDPLWYDAFLSRCFVNGFSPKIIQHIESMWKKINLVSMDSGITIIGKNFSHLKIDHVRYIPPIPEENLDLPITISYKKDNDNPAINYFMEIAKEIKNQNIPLV